MRLFFNKSLFRRQADIRRNWFPIPWIEHIRTIEVFNMTSRVMYVFRIGGLLSFVCQFFHNHVINGDKGCLAGLFIRNGVVLSAF